MLSPGVLIPFAVFVSITLGTWVVLGAIAGRPMAAEDRLRRLIEPGASRGTSTAGLAKKQEQFQAKVAAAADKLGRSIRPSNEAELGKIRLKLLNAGFRQEQAVAVFSGVKVIGFLIGVAVVFPLLVMRFGMSQTALTLTVGAGALGFYLPDFVVGNRKKHRSESIFLGLPDALDLMVV